MDKTLEYYNNNANDFFNTTFNVDVSDSMIKFLSNLEPGGKILDVGCGSGRDTLSFKNLGYIVTSFDASAELAKLASERINHPVLCLDMENISWKNEFDGVWAIASLLHLKREKIVSVISKLMEATKEQGSLFISLKAGEGEGFDAKGRFFTYYKEQEIKDIFNNLGYSDIKIFGNNDTLGRDVSWISVIVYKSPTLINKVKLK